MMGKILCIDDDPITLMLNKKVIEKNSFSKEIIVAKNGEDALNFFQSIINSNRSEPEIVLPQLIFLDLNMPVMGGWEFLDYFSTTEYSDFNTFIKVIVLSSTIDPEDSTKSKKYPMVIDFLSKPLTSLMLFYINEKHF